MFFYVMEKFFFLFCYIMSAYKVALIAEKWNFANVCH